MTIFVKKPNKYKILSQAIKNSKFPISMFIGSFILNVIILNLYNITWKFPTPMHFFIVSLAFMFAYFGILLERVRNYMKNMEMEKEKEEG